MGVDEVWEQLGVERTASPKEIRRAYLKKLKHVSPERDPEGFQRLREAYELATRWSAVASEAPKPTTDAAPDGSEPPEMSVLLEQFADRPAADLVVAAQQLLYRCQTSMQGSIDPVQVLWFVLMCLGAGERSAADWYFQWLGWATQRGDLAALSPDEKTLLLVVNELASLPPQTPTPFVMTMARGYLDRDFPRAAQELERLRKRHPKEAYALGTHVANQAPALKGRYRPALFDQFTALKYQVTNTPSLLWVAIILVLTSRNCGT